MKKTPARSNIGNDNRDDTLAQHGFKKTKQRLDILAAFSLTHTPLSAEDIFQSRKKLGPLFHLKKPASCAKSIFARNPSSMSSPMTITTT
jgi:hypothetical protein